MRIAPYPPRVARISFGAGRLPASSLMSARRSGSVPAKRWKRRDRHWLLLTLKPARLRRSSARAHCAVSTEGPDGAIRRRLTPFWGCGGGGLLGVVVVGAVGVTAVLHPCRIP